MTKFLLVFMVLLSGSKCWAEDAASRINAEIRQIDDKLDIAIYAKNISKNKEIYRQNIERYYDFASSLKLVSMLTLVDYFGFEYEFKSKLSRDENSNYYLQIHDPTFCQQKLKRIASALPKVIEGDIIIVDSNFSLPPANRHKTIADSKYCYGSNISKTHIGQNCLRFSAKPTAIGQPIDIAQSQLPYNIKNKTRTIAQGKLDRLHTKIELDDIIVNGTLAAHNGPLSLCVAVENNNENIRLWLNHILKITGKKHHGKVLVKRHTPPARSQQIYAEKMPLIECLKQSLHHSNNFTTDYILAEYAHRHKLPEWRQAGMQLKKLIQQQYGIDFSKASIKDASGLSVNNTMFGLDVAKFLEAQVKTANFEEKLAIIDNNQLAEDKQGTLKKHRLDKFFDPKEVKIYAKTGKKTGIVSLIGFAKKANGDLLSFIIIINNAYFDENQQILSKYLELESKILQILVSYS